MVRGEPLFPGARCHRSGVPAGLGEGTAGIRGSRLRRYLSGRVLPQALPRRQAQPGAAAQRECSAQHQAAAAAAGSPSRRGAEGSSRGPQPPGWRQQQRSNPPHWAGTRHLRLRAGGERPLRPGHGGTAPTRPRPGVRAWQRRCPLRADPARDTPHRTPDKERTRCPVIIKSENILESKVGME